VCVSTYRRTSDRFLEQRINIKFWVKLGRNANDTLAILSEAMRKSSVFECHKRFEKVTRTWKMMKEMVVQDITKPVKMLKNC